MHPLLSLPWLIAGANCGPRTEASVHGFAPFLLPLFHSLECTLSPIAEPFVALNVLINCPI